MQYLILIWVLIIITDTYNFTESNGKAISGWGLILSLLLSFWLYEAMMVVMLAVTAAIFVLVLFISDAIRSIRDFIAERTTAIVII